MVGGEPSFGDADNVRLLGITKDGEFTEFVQALLVRFCIPNFGTAFFGHLSNIKMSNFRTNVCFASRK